VKILIPFIAGIAVTSFSVGGVATFICHLYDKTDADKKEKINNDLESSIDQIQMILNINNESRPIINKYISIIKSSKNLFKDEEYVINHLQKILSSDNDPKILLDRLEMFIVALDVIQDSDNIFTTKNNCTEKECLPFSLHQ
jgi:hypothetical protein